MTIHTQPETDGRERVTGKLTSIAGDVDEIAEDLGRLAAAQLDAEERAGIKAAVDRLGSRGLYVVVCGEFKRGKSSLLNALLGERDVFPVDEDVATSIVTAVAYGERSEAHVFLEGEDTPRDVEVSAVRGYVTEAGNPGNAKRVRLVDIRGPFPALAPGVTFIDTPGEGCLNVEHTAATLGFLPYADALIVVVDAVEPVTTKELEFVDTARRSTTNMIFAVSKVDLVVDPQVMVNNLRAKLVQRYPEEGADIPIVPVSSVRLLDGVDDDDPDLIADSGFPALEEQLWLVLLRRAAAAAILETTSELRRTTEHVVVPLRSQVIALTEKPALTAKLRDRLEATRGRLDDAARPEAAWRRSLDEFLGELGVAVLTDFDIAVARLHDELLNVWLQSPALLTCPEEIANNVVSGLVLRLNGATDRLRDGLSFAYARIDDTLQLDASRKDLDAVSFEPDLLTLPTKAAQPNELWGRARSFLRRNWDSGGMQDLLRGLLGVSTVVVGAMVTRQLGTRRIARLTQCTGNIVSAAGDIRTGVRDLQNADMASRVSELGAVLDGYLTVNASRAADTLRDLVARLPHSVAAETEQKIADERRMVAQSLDRLDPASDEVDPTRLVALRHDIDELTRLRERLDDIDAEILGVDATESGWIGPDIAVPTAAVSTHDDDPQLAEVSEPTEGPELIPSPASGADRDCLLAEG